MGAQVINTKTIQIDEAISGAHTDDYSHRWIFSNVNPSATEHN
jgi:hypothetical protein